MPKVVQLGGGRPRKPTALKALAGTLRPSRESGAEPRLHPVPLPDPPKGLSKSARRAWLELKGLIDPMRVSTAADVFAFRGMARCAGILDDLYRSYAAAGGKPAYVEDTNAGPQVRMRPEVQGIATYEKLMFLHMANWGINPAARPKVMALLDDAPKKDSLAKFRLGGPR